MREGNQTPKLKKEPLFKPKKQQKPSTIFETHIKLKKTMNFKMTP
jgi:hypothetical protein